MLCWVGCWWKLLAGVLWLVSCLVPVQSPVWFVFVGRGVYCCLVLRDYRDGWGVVLGWYGFWGCFGVVVWTWNVEVCSLVKWMAPVGIALCFSLLSPHRCSCLFLPDDPGGCGVIVGWHWFGGWFGAVVWTCIVSVRVEQEWTVPVETPLGFCFVCPDPCCCFVPPDESVGRGVVLGWIGFKGCFRWVTGRR